MSREVIDIFFNLKNFHVAANPSRFPQIFFQFYCGMQIFQFLLLFYTKNKQTKKQGNISTTSLEHVQK